MRLFFLVLSFFAAPYWGYGQDDYVFENFSTKQGLLNNEVNRIVQDKKGYIWVSTTEGISRFDGHHFLNFRLSEKRLTHALTIDHMGVIWAANEQAIYYYDDAQNTFKKYLYVNVKPNFQLQAGAAVKGSNITALLSHQGTLWFASNEGLYRVQDKKLKKTSLLNTLLPNHLIGLQNNVLLLTTYHGTFSYDIAQDTYRFLPQIKNPQSVYVDPQQRIWWGDMGHLYRMNADSTVQKWVIKLPDGLIGVVSPVTFISPLSVRLGTSPLLWVGMFGQGIYQFDLQSERFINRISTQLGVKNGLSANQITKLFIDQDQNSWVSSYNGIDKFDPHLFRFRTEEFPFFYELGIERLRQVITLPKQPHLCWVISSGDGFFLYNRQKKQLLRRFLFGETLDRQGNNRIYEAKVDSEQTLWVSLPKAVLRVNPRTFQTQRIALPIQEKSGNCMDFDDDQTIGIGGSSGQIFFLNRKTLQVTKLSALGYRFENVFDILWDKSRKCWWFGTDKGLFSYDTRQHKINKRHNDFIDKIAIDPEKNIWFTTSDNFLVKYHPEQQGVTKYKPTFSPENFHPKGLVIDRNGVVWMNTFKGLYAFLPKNQQFQVFGEAEGLNSELSYGFLYDDGTGRIYLNYSYGFTSFNPYQTVLHRRNITPQITGISVEDSLYPFSREKFLKIRNKNSRLRFEFSHLDYTQSSKTNFYYQLEGLDTQWRLNGNTTSVTYNNLDDGEYTFRVYAVNSSGQKSPVSEAVRIEVWRPFREKPWFGWLMGFVLCSLGVWALLLYRYRQQLKLLKLRDDIARDLHDDMGSYLSSIQIQSQTAAAVMEQNPELAQNMLHTIGHTTRHVMGALRDVVWAINPENDSFEQLLIRMKEMATLLLEANGIKLDFRAEANVYKLSLEMNQRKELLMIFKEAINNIVKHAHAQNVYVELTELDKNIQLLICDDGQGFELNRPKNGNGLKNFQKRAQTLGGKLTLDSKPGNGTALFLTFPSHHRGIVT